MFFDIIWNNTSMESRFLHAKNEARFVLRNISAFWRTRFYFILTKIEENETSRESEKNNYILSL